jgi:16S rRNA U1498 N3-methylase RsmE
MVIAMPPPRFFCDTPLNAGRLVALPDALAHHALRVLRLADGDTIILFDGRGGQYPATLRVEGRRALAELGAHAPVETELRGRLVLIQGLASGDKMDWAWPNCAPWPPSAAFCVWPAPGWTSAWTIGAPLHAPPANNAAAIG